jgi:CheY-like chemotaxis protein
VKKVLLVEDDPVQIKLISFVLNKQGAEVRHTREVAEGISIAREWKPDLIISDIGLNNKPRIIGTMDDEGLLFIEAVKNNEKTKNIPLILLSASPLGYFNKTLADVKADKWLAKPLDLEALEATTCAYICTS